MLRALPSSQRKTSRAAKRLGTPAAALAVLLAACSQEAGPRVVAAEGEVQESDDVHIERRVDVDLAEISALGLRQHEGKLQLLAVGDAAVKVATAGAEDLTFDVRSVSGAAPSQWEAVASDVTGRVFVLKENPGSIIVFDPKLAKKETEIELAVSGSRWKDVNSRGEGLVLMKNGHVLVLKEKAPLELVEFGPKGESPRGYEPGAAVGVADEFPLPKGPNPRFEALKEWEMGEDSAGLAEDASEICVGPDGLLYLLSDQSKTISVLEQRIGPAEKRFKFDATWHLPKEIDKPEGLVILPNGTPIVAVDAPKNGTLFVLSKLERPRRNNK
jgi:hypothetical protein